MSDQAMDMNSIYGIPNCPSGNCDSIPTQVMPSTQTPTQQTPIQQVPTSQEEISYSSNLISQVPSLEDIAGFNVTGKVPQISGADVYSPVTQKARQQQEQVAQELASQLPNQLQNEDTMKKNMESTVNMTTQNDLALITPTTEPMPLNTASLLYLNGFMRTQIGRIVKVEFLIGSNTMVDRTGVLLAIGANYILINEIETDDILACDFYNIKFVKFYY